MVEDRRDHLTMGELIRRHRVRAGLSRVQLSGLIGKSPSWLYKVERGDLVPDRLSVLCELADALRVSIADLVPDALAAAVPPPLARTAGRGAVPSFSKISHESTKRGHPLPLRSPHRRTSAGQGAGGPGREMLMATKVTAWLRTRTASAQRAVRAGLLSAQIVVLRSVLPALLAIAASPLMRRRRSAVLTAGTLTLTLVLVGSVAARTGGLDLARGLYDVVPYTTPMPQPGPPPATRSGVKHAEAVLPAPPLARVPSAVPAATAPPPVAVPATDGRAATLASTAVAPPHILGVKVPALANLTSAVAPVTHLVGTTAAGVTSLVGHTLSGTGVTSLVGQTLGGTGATGVTASLLHPLPGLAGIGALLARAMRTPQLTPAPSLTAAAKGGPGLRPGVGNERKALAAALSPWMAPALRAAKGPLQPHGSVWLLP